MKKILAILAMTIVLSATTVSGFTIPVSATADGAMHTETCSLSGLFVEHDGSATFGVVIYDNATTASGTKVISFTVQSATRYVYFPLPGVDLAQGAYVDIDATGSGTIYLYLR